jgi:hypothetical protein
MLSLFLQTLLPDPFNIGEFREKGASIGIGPTVGCFASDSCHGCDAVLRNSIVQLDMMRDAIQALGRSCKSWKAFSPGRDHARQYNIVSVHAALLELWMPCNHRARPPLGERVRTLQLYASVWRAGERGFTLFAGTRRRRGCLKPKVKWRTIRMPFPQPCDTPQLRPPASGLRSRCMLLLSEATASSLHLQTSVFFALLKTDPQSDRPDRRALMASR